MERGDFALQTSLLFGKVIRAFLCVGLPLFRDGGVLFRKCLSRFGGVCLSFCICGRFLHFLQLVCRCVEVLRFASDLAALQVPMTADFFVEIALQRDECLPVEQFLGTRSALKNGHEIEVKVRRRLVHVNDGGDDILSSITFGEEVRAFKEEGVDVVAALILEKLRTCTDEKGRHEDGVVLHFALGRELLQPTVDEHGVAAARLDEVVVEARAVAVDLWVELGTVSLVPLVLALDADDVVPLIFFHVTNDVCDKVPPEKIFTFLPAAAKV